MNRTTAVRTGGGDAAARTVRRVTRARPTHHHVSLRVNESQWSTRCQNLRETSQEVLLCPRFLVLLFGVCIRTQFPNEFILRREGKLHVGCVKTHVHLL